MITPDPARRAWYERTELMLVFLAGFALLSHVYAWDLGSPTNEIGAPGNDSFYHTRMAALIPEHGLLHEFPWLRWTWFTNDGDRFVSHHYGFHLLLLPFVQTAQLLGYDELTGGRWFMCTMFGLQLAMMNAILITLGVRYRILWLTLVLLFPHQYFERHAFVRAVSPACVALLTLTWLILNRRHTLLLIGCALFLHLYLGAVLYVPVLIAVAVGGHALTSRRWRELPYGLFAAGLGGWVLGIFSHPYQQGMFEFLQMQVFGTGLTPDIQVGREWRPYNDVWWFFTTLIGPLFAALAIAIVLRLWNGRRLDAATLTLLLLQAVFLLLMVKARRFVEFWPPFALLSAAALVEPVWDQLAIRLRRSSRPFRYLLQAVSSVGLLVACTVLTLKWGRLPHMPNATWLVIAAFLLGASVLFAAMQARSGRAVVLACATALPLLLTGVTLATPRLEEARSNSRCRHRLPVLEEMMGYLRENTPRDAIVFTDDWDVFPAYFYHNTHNRYVVGLDPKFTHERRPDLWDRYVRITRGQVPARIDTEFVTASGRESGTMEVTLRDIRQHFEAQYVIVDDDHDRLGDLLDADWDFAEPFWPTEPDDFERARYRVYRIRSTDEAIPARPQRDVRQDLVYLSDLSPEPDDPDRYFENRMPDGGVLQTGTKKHLRGCALRGRNQLRLQPPAGSWTLRAVVSGNDQDAMPLVLRMVVDGIAQHSVDLSTAATTIEWPVTTASIIHLETIGPDEATTVLGSPLLLRTMSEPTLSNGPNSQGSEAALRR